MHDFPVTVNYRVAFSRNSPAAESQNEFYLSAVGSSYKNYFPNLY